MGRGFGQFTEKWTWEFAFSSSTSLIVREIQVKSTLRPISFRSVGCAKVQFAAEAVCQQAAPSAARGSADGHRSCGAVFGNGRRNLKLRVLSDPAISLPRLAPPGCVCACAEWCAHKAIDHAVFVRVSGKKSRRGPRQRAASSDRLFSFQERQ